MDKFKKSFPLLAKLAGYAMALYGAVGVTGAVYTSTPADSWYTILHGLLAAGGAALLGAREWIASKAKAAKSALSGAVSAEEAPPFTVEVRIGNREVSLVLSPNCAGPEVAEAISFAVKTVVGSKEGAKDEKLVAPPAPPAPSAPVAPVVPATPVAPPAV